MKAELFRTSAVSIASFVLLLIISLFFSGTRCIAALPPSDNPNKALILSSIPIPKNTTCSMDPSDKYSALYVMCHSWKEAQTRHIMKDGVDTLYTYDISDLRNPVLVDTIDLGNENGISLPYMLVRQSTAVIADFRGGRQSRFIIVDLAKPAHPKIAAIYPSNDLGDLFLSDDGHLLAFRAFRSQGIYRYFDISDLSTIKSTTYTPDNNSLSAFDKEFFDIPYFSGLTRTSGYRSRRGDFFLYENFAAKQLQLYNVGVNPPVLIKSEPHISSSQNIGGMKLLPGGNAVAFIRSSFYPAIEIEAYASQ